MSDAHTSEHDAPHEGPIKTPKQLVWAVALAFLVPIFGIILLVNFVAADKNPAAGTDALHGEAVALRIQPIGQVEIRDASAPAVLRTGEQVYSAQCVACHGTGAAGSPKFGDAAAWAPRLQTGYEALLNSALKGKGAMAAQGGGEYSDLEVGRAVVYMANQAGGKLAEPKAPEAAASAADGAVPGLYTQTCSVCHAAGVAGAPKFGDKAAWAARLPAGVDGLTASAIKGKNAMPARGGAAGASDEDIKAVVTYMVGAVQ